MRVLTAYSRDEALIDAFNTGKDLHCLTAAGISQYDYNDIRAHKEEKNSEQYIMRQLAKTINFGTVYGMGPDKLQKNLWTNLRLRKTVEECDEYFNRFFATYPGVKRYIDSTGNFAQRFGFTYTFTGRRRRFVIAEFSRSMVSRLRRQAVNARIQTTSSDLVLAGLIDLARWLHPLGGRVLLTVHDSVAFQLPKGASGVRKALDNIVMETTAARAPWLPVAWKYDVGRGPNYGDTHGEVA